MKILVWTESKSIPELLGDRRKELVEDKDAVSFNILITNMSKTSTVYVEKWEPATPEEGSPIPPIHITETNNPHAVGWRYGRTTTNIHKINLCAEEENTEIRIRVD